MRYNDNPLMEPIFFTPPGRLRYRGQRLFKGGGGGDQVKYANLEKLYGEQADSARLLRNLAETNLPGATDNYMREVGEVLDPKYAERQAGLAGSDVASSNAMERAATTRELASLGVNPNDTRFSGSLRQLETTNAARMAAGKNIARRDANTKQLAVAQDAVGTFTGQSNQAAAQLGNASSGMMGVLNAQQNQKNQQAQMQQQNAANTTAGAIMGLSMLSAGGMVPGAKRIERHAGFLGSGEVGSQQGGGFGHFSTPTPPPQQAAAPQSPSSGDQMTQAGVRGKRIKDAFGAERGAARVDKMAKVANLGSSEAGNQLGSRAAGMRMGGEQAKAAADAYEAAAYKAGDPAMTKTYLDSAANIRAGADIGNTASTGGHAFADSVAQNTAANAMPAAGEAAGGQALGAAGGQAAGAAAGEAAGTNLAGNALMSTAADTAATSSLGLGATGATGAGAAGVAGAGAGAATGAATGAAATGATTAVAGGLGAAGAAVATALPWVGAAYAVGSLLGAWADGGEVGEAGAVQDLGDQGGKVAGQWEGNTDTVPALLTEEEHVVNAEAAALAGHDEIERLNRDGLAMRERGMTPHKIRAAGLRRAA